MPSSFLDIKNSTQKKHARDFHYSIVKNLFDMAREISIVEKFQEPQPGQFQNMKRNEIEQMAERFDKLKWEVYNIPLLVVSEESDITPIYKSIEQIPKPLREFKMRIDQEDYKEYDKMTHEEIVEKILNICVSDKNRKAVREQTNLYNLVFTLDNFLKLVLIYLRVRSNIPIILMGETGVGKTSLVDFLSKIIDAEFMIKNIHAGITEEEIIDFVNKAQETAEKQPLKKANPMDPGKPRKVIMFFDEINTNNNISGLLKEIFVDRHIQGVPLRDNIALISACNPYKLRATEKSSQTSGLQLKAKDDTVTRLIYRVNPLPESMIAYIWDYKSLDEQEEKKYIEKMIKQKYEQQIQGKSFSLIRLWIYGEKEEMKKIELLKDETTYISSVVQKLQHDIRNNRNSPWAVSLRDVSRFCNLLAYFNENSVAPDQGVMFNESKKKKSSSF